MKPRIKLAGEYLWCGTWRQKWLCAGRYRVGLGPTPELAYDDWAAKTNADKVGGL